MRLAIEKAPYLNHSPSAKIELLRSNMKILKEAYYEQLMSLLAKFGNEKMRMRKIVEKFEKETYPSQILKETENEQLQSLLARIGIEKSTERVRKQRVRANLPGAFSLPLQFSSGWEKGERLGLVAQQKESRSGLQNCKDMAL